MNDYLIKKAREFAQEIHKDQKYGEYSYMVHVEAVADSVYWYNQGVNDQEALIVAYLHDTIEDGANPVEIYNKIESLFDRAVADTVVELTRKENQNYLEYIQSISTPLAITVKICDLTVNINSTRTGSRADKYRFAREFLKMKKLLNNHK